jgi:hypothetical protein
VDSPEPDSSRTRIAAAELAGRGLAAAALLVGVSVLGSTLLFCVAVHVPGPFFDSWKAMEWLASAERGSLDLRDLLRPYGGHRIFYPALLFLLEYEYFHGTNVFLRSCGFVLQLPSWLILARLLWRDRATLSPHLAGFVAGLALALLFSGTQLMNFYSPWSLAHFVALAGMVIALAALIRTRSAHTDEAGGHSTAVWTVLVILAATVSNYSLASGLLA